MYEIAQTLSENVIAMSNELGLDDPLSCQQIFSSVSHQDGQFEKSTSIYKYGKVCLYSICF